MEKIVESSSKEGQYGFEKIRREISKQKVEQPNSKKSLTLTFIAFAIFNKVKVVGFWRPFSIADKFDFSILISAHTSN